MAKSSTKVYISSIGLKTTGIKEVLGIWMSPNGLLPFWLSVLNGNPKTEELKNPYSLY
ncbi:MAG: hypothetical protein IPG79_20390 [Saprospiraceae bacterium]|nr:hypothetical protein [Saprospiraceae bacterium]